MEILWIARCSASSRVVVRDFMMNRPFRRDYWVKGARRPTAFEQAERLREERVILDRRRDEVSLEITGLLGKAVPDGPAYGMLLDALSDHRPRSLGCRRHLRWPCGNSRSHRPPRTRAAKISILD